MNFGSRAKEFNDTLKSWSDHHERLDMVILRGLRSDVVQHFYDALHLNSVGQMKH